MKKIFGLFCILSLMRGVSHGFQLTFPGFQNGSSLQERFSLVHFTLPNSTSNSYQGAFFWQTAQDLATGSWQVINDTVGTKTCRTKVAGIYYTNAKGGRLWPLDATTQAGLALLDPSYSAANLTIQGGLYTTCDALASGDLRSIYGQVSFSEGGLSYGTLTAGLMYSGATNTVDISPFKFYPTFQYFNNQTPFGFIYDSTAGIGFVGGVMDSTGISNMLTDIKTTGSINSICTFGANQNSIVCNATGGPYTVGSNGNGGLGTLWGIDVVGNVLFGRGGMDAALRNGLLQNPTTSSSVVFSDVVNTSDVLNALRKNTSTLCRGTTWDTSAAVITLNQVYTNNKKVLCIGAPGGDGLSYIDGSNPVVIDLADTATYDGKEIIVRGRNVILRNGSVPSVSNALNLFVDNGNILLQNDTFTNLVINHTNGYGDTFFMPFDAKGNMIGDAGGEAMSILNANVAAAIPVSTVVTAPRARQKLSSPGNATMSGYLSYAVYLRGNIFVNGIIAGTNNWSAPLPTPASIPNKYIVHGRVTSLNTPRDASQPRKDLLGNIFGQNDGSTYANYLRLPDVFSWSCQVNGLANTAGWPCNMPNNQFQDSAFALINTPIPTKLLQ